MQAIYDHVVSDLELNVIYAHPINIYAKHEPGIADLYLARHSSKYQTKKKDV